MECSTKEKFWQSLPILLTKQADNVGLFSLLWYPQPLCIMIDHHKSWVVGLGRTPNVQHKESAVAVFKGPTSVAPGERCPQVRP